MKKILTLFLAAAFAATANGWFASDCIRPENPVPYNYPGTGDAWNNIIVFSYDMDTTVPNVVICDFYLSHRATY